MPAELPDPAPAALEKVFISAESLLRDSFELAMRIYRGGFRPTFLVGIWRGGAPIGIAVQEALEYHGVQCDHIAIRNLPAISMDVLSMGMSHDFEVAIGEGSTCVRIGTAIFGERQKP